MRIYLFVGWSGHSIKIWTIGAPIKLCAKAVLAHETDAKTRTIIASFIFF